MFQKPYTDLPELFDGTGRFADALAVLDSVCTNWTPRIPVRLYHSPGDEEAVNANTEHCHATLARWFTRLSG